MVIGLTRGACIVIFGNGYIGWRIIASVMMAIIMTLAVPGMCGKSISSIKDYVRIHFMLAVVLLYWGDFLAYPLSDMAAWGFMCCGAALMRSNLDFNTLPSIKKIIGGIVAGACFYAAYNTRVVYLYSILALAIFFSVMIIRKKRSGIGCLV